jgi:quinol monooxygenase YgiN
MATNRRRFIRNSAGAVILAGILPASSILISCKQKPKTMNKNTLNVVAIIETSSDRAEELKKILLGLIEPTRKESGCIKYELYQDITNPGLFTFVEEWESQEHLDVHMKTPHLVAAGEAFSKIVIKETIVLRLNKLA